MAKPVTCHFLWCDWIYYDFRKIEVGGDHPNSYDKPFKRRCSRCGETFQLKGLQYDYWYKIPDYNIPEPKDMVLSTCLRALTETSPAVQDILKGEMKGIYFLVGACMRLDGSEKPGVYQSGIKFLIKLMEKKK